MDGGGLATGLILGLGGSLHCIGACGGVASALLRAGAAKGEPAWALRRVCVLAAGQVGRIGVYVVAGVVFAALGSLGYELMIPGVGRAARVLSAVVMLWLAARLAGLTPAVPSLRLRLGRFAFATAAARRPGGVARGLFLGAAWGMAPCGMVYNTLFLAILAPSPADGGLLMLGFGLATAAPVSLFAWGVASSDWRVRSVIMRRLAAGALAALALGGLADQPLVNLCLN